MSRKKIINDKLLEFVSNTNNILFTTDKDIYFYLKKKNQIDISYDTYRHLLAKYRHNPKNDIKEEKKYKHLTTQEILFCEAIEHIKVNTISCVKQSILKEIANNPQVAIKFLQMYDKDLKIENAKIKAKEYSKIKMDLNHNGNIDINIKSIGIFENE